MITERDTLQMNLRRVSVGSGRAYIYILCSKLNHVVYVGQTNDPGGVLARLASHIGSGGTFRKRLHGFDEIAVEDIDDLELFAFALPERAEFISRDETYREGVEYNVQVTLQRLRGDWKPYFTIVSNVTSPVTTDFPEVVDLSRQIIARLEQLYHS